MRIGVVSDIHGDQNAISHLKTIDTKLNLDLIVICGDITTFGPASVADSILKDLKTKCAAIPGNCDPDEVFKVIEKRSISLDMKRVKIDGLNFVGVGGSPVCTMSTPREFDEHEIEKMLSKIIVDECILVTHAPPYGINDLTRSGKRLGSKAILKLAEKFKPRLVVSGHVHEARGIVENESTIFANPGTLKDGFWILADIGNEVKAKIVDIREILQNL